MSVGMYEVTYDTINFDDMKEGAEYPDTTIEYLIAGDDFGEIDDMGQDFLINEGNQLPLLYVNGADKNNNLLSKKYVFFEREGRKYLIEISSTVEQEQNVYNSYHDMRLLRTAIELVNSPAEKDDDIPTQKVEEKK